MKRKWIYRIVGCMLITACNSPKENKKVKEPPKAKHTCSVHSRLNLTSEVDLESSSVASLQKIHTSKQMAADFTGMIKIQGGVFEMGGDIAEGFQDMPNTALPQGDELPKHPVQISAFWMDEHEVTNAQFKEFVNATNYMTTAETPIDWEELRKQLPPGTPKPAPENLLPASLVFNYAPKDASRENFGNWWSMEKNVNWRQPNGPGSSITGKEHHPVVHISWYDAMAYAKWAGKRLPTEAEWEYAMRGGITNAMYPWGNEKVEQSKHYANHLQGEFPYTNTNADGYERTAPVKSFPANNYGLYDMAGNVWEWTNDWYSAIYYKQLLEANEIAVNPQGPTKTMEVYSTYEKRKVLRGGSFLCNDSWCSGYRNARRMRNTPDTSMEHIGFRCVRDIIED